MFEGNSPHSCDDLRSRAAPENSLSSCYYVTTCPCVCDAIQGLNKKASCGVTTYHDVFCNR